jgi:hypothetical protein
MQTLVVNELLFCFFPTPFKPCENKKTLRLQTKSFTQITKIENNCNITLNYKESENIIDKCKP